MIKVAFLLNFPKDYKGGINYFKNLMYACSLEKRDDVKFFLFVPSDIEREYIDTFAPYAEIVKTDVLKRNTPQWVFEKILETKFSVSFLLLSLLKKHDIDIVSHSNFFSRYKKLKIINWIPDFQVLHNPELWDDSGRKRTLRLFKNIVKHSDRIVLSSYDAFADYKTFTTENVDKVRVMQFVSQPADLNNTGFDSTKQSVLKKLNIDRGFFYLPNQFWSHKNHITVFKAISLLKNKGYNPLLVTTGYMADYRGTDNIKLLKDFIKQNDLAENIYLLGLIPYSEVLILIDACIALLNPSLFEGWSSTVEEAKSSGKQIILSDINIHREQNPPNGIYFTPLNAEELANKIEEILNHPSPARINESTLQENLATRTKAFSQKYFEIIEELSFNNKPD